MEAVRSTALSDPRGTHRGMASTDLPAELGFDPYLALGLDAGASRESISKVARKLALKYHPDKNSEADAPALFLRVQKAKEFLLDDVKRKEFDETRAAVVKRKAYEDERSSTMDGKRKRFREDLESKLQKEAAAATTAAAVPREPHQQHQASTVPRQSDLEMMRQENMARMEQVALEQQLRREADLSRRSGEGGPTTSSSLSSSLRQIQVVWRSTSRAVVGAEEAEATILTAFKQYGKVEEISLDGASFASGGRYVALITFMTASSARSAADAFAASDGQGEFSASLVTGLPEDKTRAVLGTAFSDVPHALRQGVQRTADKHELQSRLAAESSAAASVITMEALAAKELDVLARMKEASRRKRETNGAMATVVA